MIHPFEADVLRLGYIGRQPGTKRDSDSWFTPPQYLDAVRSVLGRIDLDPFSSDAANKVVRAKRHFTQADDAFTQTWNAGAVFMNPPYGPLCRAAIEKFVYEFGRGHFRVGIVLVNNATETRFFQLLIETASALCLTNHRISFYNADGKRISGNTRGQAFFYVAKRPNVALFARSFASFGKVLPCK